MRIDLLKHIIKGYINNKARSILTVSGIIILIALYLITCTFSSIIFNKELEKYNNFSRNVIYINQLVEKDKLDNFKSRHPDVIINYFIQSENLLIKNKDEQNNSYAEYYINLYGSQKDFYKYNVPSVDLNNGIEQNNIILGRAFDEKDIMLKRKVMITYYSYAKMLIGDQNPLGQKVYIEDKGYFTIIGLLKDTKDVSRNIKKMKYNNENIKNVEKNFLTSYVPYSIFSKNKQFYINKIILIFPIVNMEEVFPMVFNEFNSNFDNNIFYYNGIKESVIRDYNYTRKIILSLLVLMAFLSGINLIVILLFSYKERLREIGIKQAIGAQKKDIFLQFYVESVLLGLIGGIVGIILGLSIISLIGPFIFKVILPTIINRIEFLDIIVSMLLSLFITMSFGILPYIISMKKNVIETLRMQ